MDPGERKAGYFYNFIIHINFLKLKRTENNIKRETKKKNQGLLKANKKLLQIIGTAFSLTVIKSF